MQEFKFDVYHHGELEAGISGYTESVTITVENNVGGDKGEFQDFIEDVLAEWFDGAKVTYVHPK